MPDVLYIQDGNGPAMVDYTPESGDLAAGTVVLFGAALQTVVTHSAIANNALGAVAAGGGVYEGINLNNAADGAIVYWENTAKKFTSNADSGNNKKFGHIVSMGGGGANSTCRVLHHPAV